MKRTAKEREESMNRFVISLAMVVGVFLSGCGKIMTLDVVHGSGSGEYRPLETVVIVADIPASNQVFLVWSGDISGIDNKTNAATSISMNQLKKTIEATYTNIVPPISWTAYSAPAFYEHGYPEEDNYRLKAIAGCIVEGLDCIAVTMNYVPNPELAIHLLEYESDVEKGKFLPDNWYRQAKSVGVNRWLVDISNVTGDAVTVYDRFKAYPAYSVRFVAPDIQSLKAILHCNDKGEKITPPEFRQ